MGRGPACAWGVRHPGAAPRAKGIRQHLRVERAEAVVQALGLLRRPHGPGVQDEAQGLCGPWGALGEGLEGAVQRQAAAVQPEGLQAREAAEDVGQGAHGVHGCEADAGDMALLPEPPGEQGERGGAPEGEDNVQQLRRAPETVLAVEAHRLPGHGSLQRAERRCGSDQAGVQGGQALFMRGAGGSFGSETHPPPRRS